MFSGIIEATGLIQQLETFKDHLKFLILPHASWDDLRLGDSVSVNGVCLTVTDFSAGGFHATVVPETLRRTNLGELALGDYVNLERSLKVGDRIGGHYVQGHVDDVGEIIELQEEGEAAWLVKIAMSASLKKYVVKKGYITLDGMSITVIDITKNEFTVTLIPHTKQVTVASRYRIGTKINLEVDILGKYVEKLLGK